MKGRWRRVFWAVEALFLAARGRGAGRGGEPRKWLILGYAAIGDTIFLLPVLEALRRRYPRAHLAFFCTRTQITAELLPAFGLVDEIIEPEQDWPDASAAERRLWADRLSRENYDAALLNLSAPAHFFQPALISIPVRVGHCQRLVPPRHLGGFQALAWKLKRALVIGELSRRLLLTHKAWIQPDGEHVVRRNMRLLESLGLELEPLPRPPRIPLPEPAREKVGRLLGSCPGRKRVGIHLGLADNPYFKIWDAARFGVLCRLLEQSGAVECFFLGSREEQASVAAARRAAGREILSLVGCCSLIETFAAIARCDLLISNDTGLAKAAMALGVPTATIWGPSSSAELGIIWEPEKHLEISSGLACSPCIHAGMARARAGIDYLNCGHHDCLRGLTAETVFAALRRKYPFLTPAPPADSSSRPDGPPA